MEMQGSAIEASGLGKVYRRYRRPSDRLWEALSGRPRHGEFAALSDVTFSLPRGEGLGIVGENGAGKSTLLKILSGVTQPSAGSFRVAGKVAAILELGAGFHPEFSGRQNAVLNAALLGLSEREVAEALPRIVDFSELGEFVDEPVKTYSTGMAMRLAFSIATQVDPEVLIIDEALSVGDGYFQKKCMDRLVEFVGAGGTVLFCSHAMYYVTSLCRHALWLRQGRAERFGPALEVVHAYEEHLLSRQHVSSAAPAQRPGEAPGQAPAPRQPARLRAARVGGAATPAPAVYRHGDPWHLDVAWTSADPRLGFHVGVGINRRDGIEVCAFSTHRDRLPPFSGVHEHEVRLLLPALPLVKGEFTVYVFLLDEHGLHVYDQRILDDSFHVESDAYSFGLVSVEHRWESVERPRLPLGRQVDHADGGTDNRPMSPVGVRGVR
jgi:lipopolysaccharide transport system ATP-binding protein